jgi:hypothetical protein
MKIKFIPHFYFFIGLFFCLTASAKDENSMIKAKSNLVKTAYLNLILEEMKFPEAQRGMGGAIAIVDGNIVLGKADATFVKINSSSWEFKNNYLPALVTGEDDLKKSKRYNLQELMPRVEDLIYNRGIYYVTYTRYSNRDDLIYFVVAKIKLGEKGWTKIYETPGLVAPYFTLGVGGKMALKNGKLYFTVGDFSLDRINGLSTDIAAQNLNLPWGKINYINLLDNTFHYYTIGHRNPLGLVFLKDGTLLSSENGPQGGDEINVIEKGFNYGWPYKSFGTKYGSFSEYSKSLPNQRSNFKYEAPIYAFVPSPALTDIEQLTGFHHKWNDDLLIGSLKAMTLFHVKLEGNRIIFVEPVLIGSRIRSLAQSDGLIYVLTDEGTILKIKSESSSLRFWNKTINKVRKYYSNI